jgi:hypothetical protein
MADETLTGSKVDVSVDTTAAAAESKKKVIIKWVIIGVLVLVAGYLIKKYIIK